MQPHLLARKIILFFVLFCYIDFFYVLSHYLLMYSGDEGEDVPAIAIATMSASHTLVASETQAAVE